MARDQRIHFLCADIGFSFVDPIQTDYLHRYHNMGVAEFVMVGAAIGLAQEGRIPVCYTITPFEIFRPFELLRTYVNHEGPSIRLVGAGRDMDYKTEGISHHAHDVRGFLNLLPNIRQFWPENDEQVVASVNDFLFHPGPTFLSLRK